MTKNREYTVFGPSGNGQMFHDAGIEIKGHAMYLKESRARLV